VELISLTRSFKRFKSRRMALLLFLVLPLGNLSFPQEENRFYEHLVAQAREQRQTSYQLLSAEFEKLRDRGKVKEEAPQEIREGKWRMLPQQIEEWQRENASSLLSLRLKALVAEVEKKPNEAEAMKAQLSSTFQSLLSQWEEPPSPPLPQEEDTIAPLPAPQPLQIWWKTPTLIGFVPPKENSIGEAKLQRLSLKLSQDIEREEKSVAKEIRKYEMVLEGVRYRCPLP